MRIKRGFLRRLIQISFLLEKVICGIAWKAGYTELSITNMCKTGRRVLPSCGLVLPLNMISNKLITKSGAAADLTFQCALCSQICEVLII